MTTSDRRFLLFSSIDPERSAYRHWIAAAQRSFDVALYVYNGSIKDDRIDYLHHRQGFKYQNFHHFSRRHDIGRYDAIWIVDDDIVISSADIDRLFALFSAQRLSLAQPAYSNDSITAWKMLYVDPLYRLRYCNFVENGVTLFSAEAVARCVDAMQDIESGYGAEFLFAALLRPGDRQVAIIDQVVCTHPASPSALDRQLARPQHQWQAETLMQKYRFDYFTPRVIGGIRQPPPAA